jgi:hypothetical protein
MFYALRKRLRTERFYRQTKGVLQTPPLTLKPGPLTIVSILTTDHVQMFLLAIKSLYRHIGFGQVVVLIEPEMRDSTKKLLDDHLPGIQFQLMGDIDTHSCQRGGCWERLMYILQRAESEYVLQMDSDTLAFGPDVAEVVECVKANRAFTLSGGEREIVDLPEAARRAQRITHPYVGIALESLFDRFPNAEQLRYVRGSAGFAGFAKGGFPTARIEDFHAQMLALLPQRATEWGTEQCGSNFAVSNSPDAVVLPHPKYGNFDHQHDPRASSFLHFIGAYRFDDNLFASLGAKVIEELRRG